MSIYYALAGWSGNRERRDERTKRKREKEKVLPLSDLQFYHAIVDVFRRPLSERVFIQLIGNWEKDVHTPKLPCCNILDVPELQMPSHGNARGEMRWREGGGGNGIGELDESGFVLSLNSHLALAFDPNVCADAGIGPPFGIAIAIQLPLLTPNTFSRAIQVDFDISLDIAVTNNKSRHSTRTTQRSAYIFLLPYPTFTTVYKRGDEDPIMERGRKWDQNWVLE
ncbi:hypothetical protein EVAR_50815_1 [Eumeta japonica]|uniref:Uncharacterized protein n=1 Tax=Eumeta variegata TaxID=151549 RepID=A0A4C1XGW5_EUMVA|nr:hypothetical protein EVAR_50815_1 [Eumeta japonica]